MSASRPPRFLVPHDAISADRVVLTGDERHHLRVRRVRQGDTIELLDDHGRVFRGEVTSLTAERAEVAIRERITDGHESPLDLTLAVAALKGDKLDLVIEKAVELGVTRVVVFSSDRSLGHPSPARLQRWQRIAVSAAKQCGRSRVPAIEGPEPIQSVASRSADVRVVCWEGHPTNAPAPPPIHASSVLVIVGPEGGFTHEEIEALRLTGVQSISLGPRILRGETAAIVAVALAQARWGDIRTHFA